METKNELFITSEFGDRFTKSLRIASDKRILIIAAIYMGFTVVFGIISNLLLTQGLNPIVSLIFNMVVSSIFGLLIQAAFILQLKYIENNDGGFPTFELVYRTSIELFLMFLLMWKILLIPSILLIGGYLLAFGGVIALFLGIDTSSLSAFFGIGYLFIIIGTIWLAIKMYSLIFAGQILIRNGLGKKEALEESIRITQGRKWGIFLSIFGYVLVLMLILFCLSLILGFILPKDNQIVSSIIGSIIGGSLLALFPSYLYLLFLETERKAKPVSIFE